MVARKQPHPITKEDFNKLLEVIKEDLKKCWKPRKKVYTPTGERVQAYLISMCLGFGSGMRISEVYGLDKKQKYQYKKKDGVEVDTIIISDIPPLVIDNFEDKVIYLSKRKKGKSGRVPIPTKLFKRAGITRETLKRKLPLKTSYRSCQNYFTAICKRVLNKHSTFHQLRHGFITELLKAGVPVHQVQLWAGHSRMDTTGAYAHAIVSDETLDQVQEVF